MEANEKTLFSITKIGNDGVHVECHIGGHSDMLDFAYVIADYMLENDLFFSMVQSIIDIREESPELDDIVKKNTIQMPDFNQLLKNKDDNGKR